MRLARVVLLAVCAWLVSPLGAATEWVFASSEHFEVYTTGGAPRARDALRSFERVHALFTEFLHLPTEWSGRTRLIVFSNDKEFAPFRPNAVAAAFYQPGPDRDQIVMRSLHADAFPLVVHEYAHFVLRHTGRRYPLWLNEGLAEFFSTLAPEGSRMNVGLVPVGRARALMSGTPLIPLERLLATGHESPEYNAESAAGLFYSESWALTHMLLVDERYRPQSEEFLATVTDETPVADVFSRPFGKSVAVVAADLLAYIRTGHYGFVATDFRSTPVADPAPARPVTVFEAGLVTANLLAAMPGREDEARAAFTALSTGHPDDLALSESRGQFESRNGHPAAARPFLARAVALGSRSPAVYRAYAEAVGASDPNEEETLLRTAVSLDPSDIESRLRLAGALVRRQLGAEALEALAAVARVPDDSAFMYFQLVANANGELGRMAEARAAAARVAEHARTDAEVRFAVDLARIIDEAAAARSTISAVAPPAPAPPPASGPLTMAQGRLKNVVCGPGPRILEVATASGTLRLVLNPSEVTVEGPGVVPGCGAQNRAARVGFAASVDEALKTVGRVRLIDFRQTPLPRV
jgi:hypothetical protein